MACCSTTTQVLRTCGDPFSAAMRGLLPLFRVSRGPLARALGRVGMGVFDQGYYRLHLYNMCVHVHALPQYVDLGAAPSVSREVMREALGALATRREVQDVRWYSLEQLYPCGTTRERYASARGRRLGARGPA